MGKSRALGRCQHHYDLFHRPALKRPKGRVCAVAGCGKKLAGRGLCSKHYMEQYIREYWLKNKEKISAQHKMYAEKNAAVIKARRKQRYAARAAELRETARKKNAANPQKNRDHVKLWKMKNPEKAKQTAANTRAKRMGAQGSHTAEEIRKLLELQKGCCAVCRCKLSVNLQKDHIVPLASGGSNWIENIQLVCKPCNNTKGSKDPIRFMQERGFLL